MINSLGVTLDGSMDGSLKMKRKDFFLGGGGEPPLPPPHPPFFFSLSHLGPLSEPYKNMVGRIHEVIQGDTTPM